MLPERTSRVFRIECARYAVIAPRQPATVFDEHLYIEIATDATGFSNEAHFRALDILVKVMEKWLIENWWHRTLAGPKKSVAEDILKGIWYPVAYVPESQTLEALATHLLKTVAGPRLKKHGLTLHKVHVRGNAPEPGKALAPGVEDTTLPPERQSPKCVASYPLVKRKNRKKIRQMVDGPRPAFQAEDFPAYRARGAPDGPATT